MAEGKEKRSWLNGFLGQDGYTLVRTKWEEPGKEGLTPRLSSKSLGVSLTFRAAFSQGHAQGHRKVLRYA